MEHAAHAPDWATALEASWIGLAMRQSLWAYPAANLIHLLGLTLLVGPILVYDLRLLGLGRGQTPVAALGRLVTPFATAGAALALASGPLLFVADAKALSSSWLLWTKLALVALALANAAAFRALHRGRLETWDERPSAFGRAQAVVSIAAWLTIGGLGRMIAYL